MTNRPELTHDATQTGTTREELQLLCCLFKADDHGEDSVLLGWQDELIRDWLDNQARLHGLNNWTEAYHMIPRPIGLETP